MFFEEEFKLIPIVISSVLIVGVLKCMHWDFTGLVPGNDLTD